MTNDNGELRVRTKAVIVPFWVNDERFEAYKIPAVAFVDLAEKLQDEKDLTIQAMSMFSLFKKSMTAEEYERFHIYAVDPQNGLDGQSLFDLIRGIVESSAARPSEQPSESGSGGGPEQAGSEEASSEADSESVTST